MPIPTQDVDSKTQRSITVTEMMRAPFSPTMKKATAVTKWWCEQNGKDSEWQTIENKQAVPGGSVRQGVKST